jgi:hypothetical protein
MAVLLAGLPRHAAPALPVLLMIGLFNVSGRRPLSRLQWPTMLVILVAVWLVAAPVGPASLRRQLLEQFNPSAVSAGVQFGVSAVTGDYWDVWPTTFALRYLVNESSRRPSLPVGLRAERLWTGVAGLAAGDTVLIVPPEHLVYWNRVPAAPRLEPVARGDGFEVRRVVR